MAQDSSQASPSLHGTAGREIHSPASGPTLMESRSVMIFGEARRTWLVKAKPPRQRPLRAQPRTRAPQPTPAKKATSATTEITPVRKYQSRALIGSTSCGTDESLQASGGRGGTGGWGGGPR